MTHQEFIKMRQTLGLTQAQFAEFLRCELGRGSRTQIQSWERGDSPVPLYVQKFLDGFKK